MNRIFKNKKVLLIISIITVVLIVGVAGTYAWYFWSSSEEDRTRILTSVGAATVVYEDGASLVGQNIKPVDDKSKGIVKNISVRTNTKTTNVVSFNLYLDINTLDIGLKHESFRFELWKEDLLVKEGNFTEEYLIEENGFVTCNKNETNHIVLLKEQIINTVASKYTLYIWIDGVNYTNPDTMMDQNFSFKLHADGQGAIIGEANTPDISGVTDGTLAYNIVNTYNTATNKTSIYNGGIKYYYDTENNLMADVDGNVRYYGGTPNNYVYFNCNDYSNQNKNTCEKWRIIGVFDGKVKIVRDEGIGEYSWDFNEDGTYYNYWNEASLNELLNNGYYNNSDNISFYNNSTTPSTINFASNGVGIKNDTTRSMISENVWHLGAFDTSDIYSNSAYNYERSNDTCTDCYYYDTTWTGNIGLMYPSDYGYAADFTKCSSSLIESKGTECTSNNWMYKGVIQWLITPYKSNELSVKMISSEGGIGYGYRANSAPGSIVRPTLYLDSSLITYGGDGSEGYPYKLYFSDRLSDLEKGNAAQYITNLYANNNPIHHEDEDGDGIKDEMAVPFSHGTYYVSYFGNWNIFNDGLGGTVYDDSALKNATIGNIRYAGLSPDNYIYFNCDNYSEQSDSTCEKWRIIGVFDGRLKLINNDYVDIYNIDEMYFNYDEILNVNFYNNIVKTDTKSLISNSLWYYNTDILNEIYGGINEVYVKERNGTPIYGNIGLMYMSDYGYAGLDECITTDVFSYETCMEDSWLFTGRREFIFNFNSEGQFIVSSNGSVDRLITNMAVGDLYNGNANIRPVLYLNSDVEFAIQGDGSEGNPYQLMVN